MSDYGPYPSEIGGIGRELMELLHELELHELATKTLQRLGVAGVAKMTEEDREKALKFLSATPSQRAKSAAKKKPEELVLLALRGRYMVLKGLQVLSRAEAVGGLRGSGYRDAAYRVANIGSASWGEIEPYALLEPSIRGGW